MESTRGIKPVEANPFLFEKIVFKLEERNKPVSYGKSFSKGWAFAVLVVLVLNIISFNYLLKDSSAHQKQSGYQELSKEMGLTNTYNY